MKNIVSADLVRIVSATLFAVAVGQNAKAATVLPGTFSGASFATSALAKVAVVGLHLGETAVEAVPCLGTGGRTRTNTVTGLQLGTNGSLGTFGTATDTVLTDKTATTATVTDTSTLTGVNLLGGLVTADAIVSKASVSATATKITSSPAGSSFVNLKVGGTAVSGSIGQNAVIDIPGIGQLLLNHVTHNGDFRTSGSITVEAAELQVQQSNRLGLPIGLKVVLAYASAGYSRIEFDTNLSGHAYATDANAEIGSALHAQLGETAGVSFGCRGTSGKSASGAIAALSAGQVITLGAGNTTAFGGSLNGATVAKTSAVVATANLLGNLIQASDVRAFASESVTGKVRTRSTAGSGFGGLVIAGLTIPLNVPANTTVALPLIGRVVINEQLVPNKSDQTEVNGLHVTVSTPNLLGLPVGAEIKVAHADASAAPR